MKNLKYLIAGLVLIMPFKISAASLSLSVNCPDSAYAGDTVSCTVSASTSGDINGISGNYSLSSGLTYNSFAVSSSVSFNVNQTSAKGFVLGNTSGFPGSFTLGTLKVTVPSNASAGTSYTVTINNIGGSDLDYNDIPASNVSDTIKVKAKEVVKPEETPKEETKPTVKPENNNSSSNNNTSNSGTSNNISTSKPTTNNNSSNAVKKSNNANLKSISLSEGNLTFLPYETEYELNVDYTVENIKINYEVEDSKASAKIDGNSTLKVGENIFKIIVTAEDGTEKTYTIKVNRAEEGKELSSNNYLSVLEVEGYNINFNKETLEYSIKIKNEESLNIITEAEEENAKVYVEGNKELKDGSVIKVLVTAEDNTTREYIINIEKGSNIVLPITLISVALVGIITAVIIIIKNRRR